MSTITFDQAMPFRKTRFKDLEEKDLWPPKLEPLDPSEVTPELLAEAEKARNTRREDLIDI